MHPSERIAEAELNIARQIDLSDRHKPNSEEDGDVFGGPKIGVFRVKSSKGHNSSHPVKWSLLHDCLHDGIFEIPVHLAVRIVGLDHHHADEFLLRVHPEVGAVGSVPAEAALRNAAARGDGSLTTSTLSP